MDDGTVSTTRYVLIFAAVYGILTLAVALFAELTGIEPNSGVSSGMFLAAVILPAHRFAKDHDRLPSMRERLMFSLGCLVVSAGASLAFFGAASMIEGDQGSGAGVLETFAALFEAYGPVIISVAVVVSVVYFAVSYFCFRWFAKIALKSYRREGAT